MKKNLRNSTRSVFDLAEKIREEQVLGPDGVAEKQVKKCRRLFAAETYKLSAASAAVLLTAFFPWFVWVTIGLYAAKKVVDFLIWNSQAEKVVDTNSLEYWQNKGLLSKSRMIQVPITTALCWSIFAALAAPKLVIVWLAIIITLDTVATVVLALTGNTPIEKI